MSNGVNNMSHGWKSGSTIVAGVLAQQSLGFQFTSYDLLEIVNTDPKQDRTVTLGSVSGFLNKANKQGAVAIIGTARANKMGGPRIMYELVDPTKFRTTDFEGGGSIVGRQDGHHDTSAIALAKALAVAASHSATVMDAMAEEVTPPGNEPPKPEPDEEEDEGDEDDDGEDGEDGEEDDGDLPKASSEGTPPEGIVETSEASEKGEEEVMRDGASLEGVLDKELDRMDREQAQRTFDAQTLAVYRINHTDEAPAARRKHDLPDGPNLFATEKTVRAFDALQDALFEQFMTTIKVKTLADFSVEEIIDELRRRVVVR